MSFLDAIEAQRPLPQPGEMPFVAHTPPFDPALGEALGNRYELLSILGEGGMSVVYLARDHRLERQVAIKVLHRHLSRDPEARARFSREAKAVAKLAHPHIPEVYDFSQESDGVAYLISEYIDGPSLAGLLQSTKLLPEHGVLIALGVLRALSHAHLRGIVHRDVKPENILLGRDGVVRLTDFGIAQVAGLESMTQTGTLIGSPAHMAPEQIEGGVTLTHQADIWAFGTVLYMLLTAGALPFRGDNTHQLLKRIVDGHYEDPRRISPHVDSTLTRITQSCLSLDPRTRPERVELIQSKLEAWLSSHELALDEREELKLLLADPAGHTALFSTSLPERLFQAAAKAERAHHLHEALELYGRILFLTPDCPQAGLKLRKLERRLRARRGLLWLALGSGVVVLLSLLVPFLWPNTAPSSALSPPQVSALSPLTMRTQTPFFSKRAPVQAPPPIASSKDSNWGQHHGSALQLASQRPIPREKDLVSAQGRRKITPSSRIAEPVSVRFTAYPPALRLMVNNRTISPGTTLALLPGSYQVKLTHPNCPTCEERVRTLDVPADARQHSAHFTYEQPKRAFEPATLFVRCAEGGYVLDDRGRRYACNMRHELPVHSSEPQLLTLQGYSASNTLIKRQQFTISAKRPIVWSL